MTERYIENKAMGNSRENRKLHKKESNHNIINGSVMGYTDMIKTRKTSNVELNANCNATLL